MEDFSAERGKRSDITQKNNGKEKARPCGRAFGVEPGDDLLSHAKCTLPSAQLRFTSEFGMGSGGSTALISPRRRLGRRHPRKRMRRQSRRGLVT